MCLASANAFIGKDLSQKEQYKKELYQFNDAAGTGYFDSFQFKGISFSRTHGFVNNLVEISKATAKTFLSIHIFLGASLEGAIGHKIDPYRADNLQIEIISGEPDSRKSASSKSEATTEISIALDEQAYTELAQDSNFPPIDINSLNGNLNVGDMGLLHKTLLHLMNFPYPMNQFEYIALQGYCYAAIGEILNRSFHHHVTSIPLKLGAAERVKLLIDSDVKNNQTIRQLANISGTNECYLKKEFRVLTGFSIMDYRQRQRMRHAQMLLVQGELNLDVLAAKVGYQNTAHFVRIFRRHIGVHPKEYYFPGEQAS